MQIKNSALLGVAYCFLLSQAEGNQKGSFRLPLEERNIISLAPQKKLVFPDKACDRVFKFKPIPLPNSYWIGISNYELLFSICMNLNKMVNGNTPKR